MPATLESVHPVLAANDVPASVRFYERLGFTLTFQDASEAPRYVVVQRDAVALHIQWTDVDPWASTDDRPAYRFVVDDVDAFYRELSERGVVTAETTKASPWGAPADTPWGTREFHLWDPGKNSLQFYRPR